MSKRVFFPIIIAALLLAVLPVNVAAQDMIPWPTADWSTSTSEEQGIDSEQFIALLDYIEREQIPLHSLLIVRNGYLVLDAYVYPFQTGMKHQTYSVTKSFNVALLGIAIEEGYIEGVDQRLVDVFSDRTIANLDEQKQAITLRHVLTMSAGLGCQDETGSDWSGLNRMVTSANWSQFMLDLPMAYKPGTQWTYCDGLANLLAAAIQEQTGISPLEYGRERLFSPLGISDIEWDADPQGVNFGGDGLQLTPHDMAKFGYLFLNRGVWDGEQIVPADWVDFTTCADPTTCPFFNMFGTLGYGHQWWTESAGGYYMALGLGGQFIFVVPDLNMVIVTTAGALNGDGLMNLIYGLVNPMILPAATDGPLPENSGAVARLNDRLTALADPSEPSDVPPLPELARQVSGITYDITPEPFDFLLYPAPALNAYVMEHDGNVVNLALTFEGEDATLKLVFADDYILELPVGLDNVWRVSESRFGPLAAKGFWQTDDTFRVNIQHVNNAEELRVDINFGDVPIQMTLHELTTDVEAIVVGNPQM